MGYTVEGKIALSELRRLNLLKANNVMRVGIFRAEFTKTTKAFSMQWISWVKPNTQEPDFHVESAFGEFIFQPTP